MEGSLYDLFGVNKELGSLPYDPYSLFNSRQQQQATPIGGVYHNEESLDFTELVEACEKNVSPLSGSTRSSTGSFLDPEPSFTFENLLPDLNMYSGVGTVPFATTTASIPIPPTTYSHHLTSSLPNMSTTSTNSIFSSPPILSPAPPSIHMVPSTPLPLTPSTTPHSKTLTTARGSNNKLAKKVYDKNSEEYKDRRERNNVAVRKSRNKSKQRAMETEVRVKELEEENVALQNKIALLMKELNVLKNLFSSADHHQSTTNPPLVVKSEATNGNSLTNFSS